MTDVAGISRENCAAGCNADGCVISGKNYCTHPLKGGLPFDFKDDPEIQKRYAEACAALGVNNIQTMPERLTP